MSDKTIQVKSVVCIVIGAISIILGIVVFGMNTGGHTSHRSYGGDAYTGMQNASADAANNIISLIAVVSTGLGGILLVLGLAFLQKGLFSLISGDKTQAETKEAITRETEIQTQSATEGTNQPTIMEETDELTQLKQLRDEGVINQEDFDQKKQELLA